MVLGSDILREISRCVIRFMILIRRYFKSSIFAAFALLLPGAAWSRGLQPVQELVYGCGTSDQIKAGAFAQLARVVTASADREVELRSAQSAIQKEQSIRVAVSSGNWSEEPYQQASRIAEQAVGASSRDLAELFERSSRDQFARSHFYAALKRISWAANLSDGALIYAYYVIGSEGCGAAEEEDVPAIWLLVEQRPHQCRQAIEPEPHANRLAG